MSQLWIGSTDYHGLLCNVGGYHIGSYAALEAQKAVEHGIVSGHIQERIHYFPDGATAPAYELTDEGLAYLRRTCGEKAFRSAGMTRKWYRDRVKKQKDATLA